MTLKSLLKRIATTKQKVQTGAKFDKINLADDTRERSKLATSVVDRNARKYVEEVLGEDITVMPEDFDTNQSATMAMQEFVFTSVEESPAANLLTLEIIADTAESIEVDENHIKVMIEDGVSTHDSVKALIDGDSTASAMVTVAVNAGEGLTLVTAEDTAEFSGALG